MPKQGIIRQIKLKVLPMQSVHILSYSLKYRSVLPDHLPPLTHLFDCRAIDNPGRIADLKSYTGLDQPVIDFFQSNPRALAFADAIETIIVDGIDRYLERDYGPMVIGFGCTGGQHRSVFFASRLHTALCEHAAHSSKLAIKLSHLDIDSRYGQR